ncbi:KGGVGR-motif variant AAA ATPase [Azospirillum sp. ST 5-10]|uniref:KGGVGR-motif variant AAA ATPase n=1 Tax=unclassified Azospirillum TaxID=2630922 RepID=UPI003F49CA39
MVETVSAAGVPLDAGTVFLRDGSGRLVLAREALPDPKGLADALRDALDGYCAAAPVVSGRLAIALIADPAALPVTVSVGTTEHAIRFIDRRFVGADWMVPPAAAPKGAAPRLVFSSLKGGVGRSTALAVLAADLARRGRKVLAIDLDLEAPGIGSMLLEESDDPGRDRRPKYGVLDYLVENGLGGIADEELPDFVGVSPFAGGSVDVVPVVGRVTDDHPASMLAKLARALVEDGGPGGPVPFERQVREMVDRFAARRVYDAVLIDARAGLAESSAPALLALGAQVLFFGIDEPQTFRGYRYLFAHLLERFGGLPDGFTAWRERVSFVQAKAPSSPERRDPFRERLHDLCVEFLYDAETLESDGTVKMAEFNFALSDTGLEVPHNATHVNYHSEYAAFDVVDDRTRLNPDVYRGPFGAFLERAWGLLGLEPGGTV